MYVYIYIYTRLRPYGAPSPLGLVGVLLKCGVIKELERNYQDAIIGIKKDVWRNYWSYTGIIDEL